MPPMLHETATAPAEPRAFTWLDSPVGPLIVAANDSAVCLIEFSEQEALEGRLKALHERYPLSRRDDAHPLLLRTRDQMRRYFGGELRQFDLPLGYAGSCFQESVWSALLGIPYGQTRSYLDVALTLGDAQATRAVGAANGANPIAIVVPCHRVINANGDLGGYGGGLWRKRMLLDLEQGQARLPF